MENDELVDQVCQYVRNNAPAIPELGWHDLEEVVRQVSPGLKDAHWKVVDEHCARVRGSEHPSLEVTWRKVRLRREEPWPVEVRKEGDLRFLLALASGLEMTDKDVAAVVNLTATSVYQRMVLLCDSGAVKKVRPHVYQLDISLDRQIWIVKRSGTNKGRITTLRHEQSNASLTSQMNSLVPHQIIVNRMIASLDRQITALEYHLDSLRRERDGLKAMLTDGSGKEGQ